MRLIKNEMAGMVFCFQSLMNLCRYASLNDGDTFREMRR